MLPVIRTRNISVVLATTQEKHAPVGLDAMAVQEIDHPEEMERCINSCFEAAEVCEWCADECADHGEEMAECLRLCWDVADLATQCARMCSRGSTFHTDTAELCAEACEACAEECEQHDHEHCQVCAQYLQECAETCRNMVSETS